MISSPRLPAMDACSNFKNRVEVHICSTVGKETCTVACVGVPFAFSKRSVNSRAKSRISVKYPW
jgi:hypothetical protein